MSDVVLASVAASQRITVRPDKVLADALPAPATTLREFPAADTIAVYAEVYDNDRQHEHDVETTVVISNEQGEAKARAVETHVSAELAAADGVIRIKARLPLAGLTPGAYTLAVNAHQTANRTIATGRAIAFHVVSGSGGNK